jgi:hypothetical protein
MHRYAHKPTCVRESLCIHSLSGNIYIYIYTEHESVSLLMRNMTCVSVWCVCVCVMRYDRAWYGLTTDAIRSHDGCENVCWRMLTYADVCIYALWQSMIRSHDGCETWLMMTARRWKPTHTSPPLQVTHSIRSSKSSSKGSQLSRAVESQLIRHDRCTWHTGYA